MTEPLAATSTVTRDGLRAMPKIELHCHIDGSLRPDTMIELAREQGVVLPYDDADALRTYMHADDVSSLQEYLDRFDVTISVLQTAEALERTAFELVQDVAADGVRYAELRNAPHLNTRGGLSLDEVVEATLRGLSRGEAETGTIARFIVCSLRHWDPARSREAAAVAVRHRDHGVVGFDLAGPEAQFSAADHAEAFRYARSHFLSTTCHAGEAAGPDSVKAALFQCNANRIGHGVRSGEDPELLAYIRDHQIALELCPSSNVQTHAVTSLRAHPVKRYLDYGVAVTINTDSRLVSATTLTDEFHQLVAECDFTLHDLATCVLNGARAAFLPLDDRLLLAERMQAELQSYVVAHHV